MTDRKQKDPAPPESKAQSRPSTAPKGDDILKPFTTLEIQKTDGRPHHGIIGPSVWETNQKDAEEVSE